MPIKDDPRSRVKAAEAKALMDRHNAKAVMVLVVHKDGVIDTATYGATQGDCDVIAEYRNGMMAKLPKAPFQTYFGWGNGGAPKPLTPAELEVLTPQQRAYVVRNTYPSIKA